MDSVRLARRPAYPFETRLTHSGIAGRYRPGLQSLTRVVISSGGVTNGRQESGRDRWVRCRSQRGARWRRGSTSSLTS